MQGISRVDPPGPGEPPTAGARDPFAGELAEVLRSAAQGEFERCRSALTRSSEGSGRPAAERATCLALLALTALALGDDAHARPLCRRAAAAARRRKSDGPRLRRWRRVALALVACVRDLAAGRNLAAGHDLVPWPELHRDYAAFIAHVCARVARRTPAGPVTPAESEVLRLVAGGCNATQIAGLLGRSPHTVRAHLRNIGVRLDTRGRRDMLARARELGVLAPGSPTRS
jgi:DNA-binding CsgD family transcriptional regulator